MQTAAQTKPAPNFLDEGFLAQIDKAMERIKALPYEQTPAFQRAMSRQIQAQHVQQMTTGVQA